MGAGNEAVEDTNHVLELQSLKGRPTPETEELIRLAGSLSLDERDEVMTIIEIMRGQDSRPPVDDGPDDNWGGW